MNGRYPKRRNAAILALLFAAVSGGCAARKGGTAAAEIDGYRTWDRTTLASLSFPIPGHESHFRRIFINPVGSAYRASRNDQGKPFDYPDGTIVVKEIYAGLDVPAAEEAPIVFDIMVKDRRSEDSRAGWRWIVRDAAKGTDTTVKGYFCVNCHGGANETHPYGDRNKDEVFKDYLFY